MNRILLVSICCSAIACRATAKDDGLKAYSLITMRNIFDSTRKPKKVTVAPPRKVEPVAKTIALVGVAVNGTRKVAFFTSADKTFSGMAAVGEKRGDLSIVSLTKDSAVLRMKEKEFTCPVGGMLTDQAKGEWKVNAKKAPLSAEAKKKNDEDAALDDLIDGL